METGSNTNQNQIETSINNDDDVNVENELVTTPIKTKEFMENVNNIRKRVNRAMSGEEDIIELSQEETIKTLRNKIFSLKVQNAEQKSFIDELINISIHMSKELEELNALKEKFKEIEELKNRVDKFETVSTSNQIQDSWVSVLKRKKVDESGITRRKFN